MKKALLAVFLSGTAFGAAGVQQTISQLGTSGNWVLAYNWTADGSGNVPNTVAELQGCCNGYYVVQVETVPGAAVAPTVGYSVKILDSAGVDMLGSAASSLSNTLSQGFSAATTAAPIQGTFTLSLSGNSVPSATGTVYVFIAKQRTVNVAAINTAATNWLSLTNSPVVDIRVFGGDPTGVSSSTVACNSAAAAAQAMGNGTVLFPYGTYKFTDACIGTGSIVFDGQGSVILVPPSFNLSAVGVLVLNYAMDANCPITSDLCPGVPKVRDISIRFQNTDTTNYASLVNFPPGIACGDYYGCDYASIDSVKITQAMTGISIHPNGVAPAWVSGNTYAAGAFASVASITYVCATGGCSGTTSPVSGGNWVFVEIGTQVRLSNIEISAFNYGIVMNGSDNEETLSNYQFYPHDMTGNQGQIWGAHGTALWTAGLYDLAMTNFKNSNFPVTMDFEYDPTYGRGSCTFATVSSLMVDTANGVIKLNCGQLSVASGVWKLGFGQVATLTVNGTLNISSGLISNAINTGIVNTAGTAVSYVSGLLNFAGLAAGGQVLINGLPYTIQTWNSNISITLTSTAGTQTGVVFSTETPLFSNNGVLGITNVTFLLGQGGSWQIVSNVIPGDLLFNDNIILNSSTSTNYLIPAIYNHDGGKVMAVGNYFPPIGSNTGTAILFDTGGGGDSNNWVNDNYFNGWGFTKPFVALNGYYQLIPTGVGAPTFGGCGTVTNVGYSSLSQSGTFQSGQSTCTLTLGNLPSARGYACTLTDTTTGTFLPNVGFSATSASFNAFTSANGHFFVYSCNPW